MNLAVQIFSIARDLMIILAIVCYATLGPSGKPRAQHDRPRKRRQIRRHHGKGKPKKPGRGWLFNPVNTRGTSKHCSKKTIRAPKGAT